MMARTRSTVRLRLRRHEIAYTMSSPALTEAVFPLNRSVMAYLIVSMAKMRKTVQILATLMNLPVIMETVRTSTMSVMVFGTAEMVLMNEIALQDAVMTTSLHVMMDPAHTKAINATAVTIVLTAAMNIIAIRMNVTIQSSHVMKNVLIEMVIVTGCQIVPTEQMKIIV
uniref:(northern house mosquito) hypothetical protein n=1 Tax=Culex pipiens TaxID=7175 RepID=A0A8D8IVK4_CULPI